MIHEFDRAYFNCLYGSLSYFFVMVWLLKFAVFFFFFEAFFFQNKQLPRTGYLGFEFTWTKKWRGVWKAGTYVVTAAVLWHFVFNVDYSSTNKEDHVFTGIRRWKERKVDEFLGKSVNSELKEKTEEKD